MTIFNSPILGSVGEFYGTSTAGGNGTPKSTDVPQIGNGGDPPLGEPPREQVAGLADLDSWYQDQPWARYLGYAALAFGGYKVMKSRQLNAVALIALVYGLYSVGWVKQLIPQNTDGSPNWPMIAVCAVLPPTAAALIGGIGGVIVSIFAHKMFKTGRRRFTGRKRYTRTSYRGRRFRSRRWR